MSPPDRSSSFEETVARGREAYAAGRWSEAFTLLARAEEADALGPADLEQLAAAAHLVGREEECQELWARAHQARLDAGDLARAARCAFWLGLGLLMRGEQARGGGWIARARRILDEHDLDCVERGFLLLPVALGSLAEGDPAAARATFEEALEIARRFGDAKLSALARLGRGQSLVREGRVDAGLALLDEVMVALETDDLDPVVVGIVYCAGIELSQEAFDLRRAVAWTGALSRWCAARPDLVPYRGQCLIWRSEIMLLQGEWGNAMDEAERACRLLSGPQATPVAGSAFYQRGELHRLRGEWDEGEAAYREANRRGRRPQPGLALLRLARGDVAAAAGAIGSALTEVRGPLGRLRMLSAHTEIMLAAGEVSEARTSVEELEAMAEALDTPLLHAMAASAMGALLLEEGEPEEALERLRPAWEAWRDLDAPYEAARVRVRIGLACRALGHPESAELEFDGARWVFESLGARPDLVRLDRLAGPRRTVSTHGLSPRELQVLRHVAGGETNKAIGRALFISERTVERHVSNIFTKLSVASRAAATAYAYEHDLV